MTLETDDGFFNIKATGDPNAVSKVFSKLEESMGPKTGAKKAGMSTIPGAGGSDSGIAAMTAAKAAADEAKTKAKEDELEKKKKADTEKLESEKKKIQADADDKEKKAKEEAKKV